MENTRSFLKIAVRNAVIAKTLEEKECYGSIRDFKIVDNDEYIMIIVGTGVHGQAPMNLDGIHNRLMEILSSIPEIAREIRIRDARIRSSYEFVQWTDEEDEYNSTQYNYIHGYADYTERVDDEAETMELFEGIAKPKMALYAKNGSEWSVLSGVDFNKYGVAFDASSLSGKKVFTFGYENEWKPDAKMIESMNKEIESALSSAGTKDLLYVICHPIMDAYRYSYYFGTELHNSDYGEELDYLLNADAFFENQPDFEDVRAVVKNIASTISEEVSVTEEEWECLKNFGLDTDAIQEEIGDELYNMLGSMRDLLETMKENLGIDDDEEDDEYDEDDDDDEYDEYDEDDDEDDEEDEEV